MKRFIYILSLVFAAVLTACHDDDNEIISADGLYTIQMSDDHSTHTMENCIGTFDYDYDEKSYVFYPDMYYGTPFHGGQELGNCLLLKNIPDTLKEYVGYTMQISGTYIPLYTKTQRGTNCPWIENVFDAKITSAKTYKLIHTFPRDSSTTYTMEDCVGTLRYDVENERYVFRPDKKYRNLFESDIIGGLRTLIINNIADTLKSYAGSVLKISGTYTPLEQVLVYYTSTPNIEDFYNAEITKAEPYQSLE